MKNKIYPMCLCSLFTVLIAIGAFIRIPIFIVPFTLQTFFIILASLLLGEYAYLSVLLYIVIGLLGIPVFTNGGGISYILQPTFGYLLGFLFASFIIGKVNRYKNDFKYSLIISLIGLFIIYGLGGLYFSFIQSVYYGMTYSFQYLVSSLFLMFLPSDLFSCVIACMLTKRLNNLKFSDE